MEFINYIQKFGKLSPEAQLFLQEKTNKVTKVKGTDLVKIGQVSHAIFFICKGSARIWYYKDGNDITDYFGFENQLIGGTASFFVGTPSTKGIQLTENSEIIVLKRNDLEAMYELFPETEKIVRLLITYFFLELQQRIENLQFCTAEQRYEILLQTYPNILNRIPLKFIASFLGITQVSLSRIRGK